MEPRPSSPGKLRQDIDSGRTGDKNPTVDPAAAPLGTDEETAGTPVAPSAAGEARARETGRPFNAGHRGAYRPRWLFPVAYGGVVIAVLAAAIVLVLYV